MCNPRRVTMTATRELEEAWQREVSRTSRLSAQVAGEARIRQPLGANVGGPALAALERALREDPAWQRQDDGSYRHEVAEGYVLYHPDEREIEIVARRTAAVEGTGEASQTLSGTLRATVSAEGEGRYYDDGWGGHTPERAQQMAEQQAQGRLDAAAREDLAEAGQLAEAEAASALQARADAVAGEDLARRAAERQAELEAQARRQLDAVGVRCRRAFHEVLARAYRDALLAYARRQGAEIVSQRDDAGVLDVELRWSR